MIKEYKISENVLELEDLMVNYLYGKGDYPPKVREALDNLNNAILDNYSEQTIEDYAMGINFSRVMSVKYGNLLNCHEFFLLFIIPDTGFVCQLLELLCLRFVR